MELGKRLKSVYNLLPDGCTMIDVGTDHCYLPIYAVKQGKVHQAYASDMRVGPLENGRENARLYGVSDRIITLLSDGLDALTPMQINQIDTFVFAGMGGILISELMDRAEFLKDKSKTVILQPMTAIYELRDYLRGAGFGIEQECLSDEGGKLYLALKCRYGAPISDNGNPFAGIKSDALFDRYLAHQKERFTKQKIGLEKGNETADERYGEVLLRLRQIEEAAK